MCIAIIEVTYRNDAATDEPALIKVFAQPESAAHKALHDAINTLKENDNVYKFKIFSVGDSYHREETWITTCNV